MSDFKCFRCGDGHTPLYCLNCANEMAENFGPWKSETDARLSAAKMSLELAHDEIRKQQERLALYESAQELITTPSGRVWIASEKHEAVVKKHTDEIERLRASINCN